MRDDLCGNHTIPDAGTAGFSWANGLDSSEESGFAKIGQEGIAVLMCEGF